MTEESNNTVGRIAENLVLRLAPKSVLHVACGSSQLVKALCGLDVQAVGIDASEQRIGPASWQIAQDQRFDLVISIDATECFQGQDDLFLRMVTAKTDSLLFGNAPVRLGKSTFDWIRLLAAHGFAPDIGFDARFISAHAMLLRRASPLPQDSARLFAECIDHRYAAARQNGIREQEQPDTAANVELTRYKERAAMLEEQLAREREYLDALRGVHAYLVQDMQRLRERSSALPGSAASIDMDALTARLRAELRLDDSSSQTSHAEMWRMVQQHSDLRAEFIRLERRTTGIERSVQSLASTVDGILQSRIWKTLVSLSGRLLRIKKRS